VTPSPPTPSSIDAADTSRSPRGVSTTGGLGAAMLLSSGVIGAVVAKRRRQLRRLPVNARLAAVSPEMVGTETVLRAVSDPERIARIEVTLRAVASELVSSASGAGTCVGVLGLITDAVGRIDVLLTGPVPSLPAPFVMVSPHCWRLDAAVDIAELASAAARSNQPCPALAHIGSTPIELALGGPEDGQLFIDLEAVGLLTVAGDEQTSTDIVRAIAAGLCVSPMAETAHIVTFGFEAPALDHPSFRATESLDEALDAAASAIGTTVVATSSTLSTFALRARLHSAEPWEPAIVLAALTDGDRSLDPDLVALGRSPGRGMAVVASRPVDGAMWRLEPQNAHWILRPLDIEVRPVGIGMADACRIGALLDDAAALHALHQPDTAAGTIATVSSSASDAPGDDAWTLMIRVFGPVQVVDRVGNAAVFERSKALELVAWLGQHRERASRSGARAALWSTDVRDATFANVVSDARRALARLVVMTPTMSTSPSTSTEWIGRTLTEQLPLHARVVCDADIIRSRMHAAAGLPAVAAIAMLQPAVALVRDAPFAGTSYLWPEAEGIASQLILLATSAAAVLAGHSLAVGDTAGVFWATGQGLLVLPGHEELIGLRMRAYARQGDLAGVRQEWDSYERVLNADPWSSGDPAPKLITLRGELLGTLQLAGR